MLGKLLSVSPKFHSFSCKMVTVILPVALLWELSKLALLKEETITQYLEQKLNLLLGKQRRKVLIKHSLSGQTIKSLRTCEGLGLANFQKLEYLVTEGQLLQYGSYTWLNLRSMVTGVRLLLIGPFMVDWPSEVWYWQINSWTKCLTD